MYAIKWQEFDRNDRVTTKMKEFKTEEAMTKFIDKLFEKDSFYQVLAISSEGR